MCKLNFAWSWAVCIQRWHFRRDSTHYALGVMRPFCVFIKSIEHIFYLLLLLLRVQFRSCQLDLFTHCLVSIESYTIYNLNQDSTRELYRIYWALNSISIWKRFSWKTQKSIYFFRVRYKPSAVIHNVHACACLCTWGNPSQKSQINHVQTEK